MASSALAKGLGMEGTSTELLPEKASDFGLGPLICEQHSELCFLSVRRCSQALKAQDERQAAAPCHLHGQRLQHSSAPTLHPPHPVYRRAVPRPLKSAECTGTRDQQAHHSSTERPLECTHGVLPARTPSQPTPIAELEGV